MANPIMELLNQSNNQSTTEIINSIKRSSNPNLLLQSIIKNNPNYSKIMQYINQNGGDPKTAFYNLARQRGVNPNDILQMLK